MSILRRMVVARPPIAPLRASMERSEFEGVSGRGGKDVGMMVRGPEDAPPNGLLLIAGGLKFLWQASFMRHRSRLAGHARMCMRRQ